MTEEEKRRRLAAYQIQNFAGPLKVQQPDQQPTVSVSNEQPTQNIRVQVTPTIGFQQQPQQEPLKVSTPYSVRNFMSSQPQQKTGLSALISEINNPTTKLGQIGKTVNNIVSLPFKPVIKSFQGTYDLTRAGLGQVTGDTVARDNALKAAGADYNAIADIPREFVSRPAAQIVTSAKNPTNNNTSYTPGSTAEKVMFGDRPVQSIQVGVRDTYRAHANDPEWKKLALAGGYGAYQIAGDIPLVGTAVRGVKLGSMGLKELLNPAAVDIITGLTRETNAAKINKFLGQTTNLDKATTDIMSKELAAAKTNDEVLSVIRGYADLGDASSTLGKELSKSSSLPSVGKAIAPETPVSNLPKNIAVDSALAKSAITGNNITQQPMVPSVPPDINQTISEPTQPTAPVQKPVVTGQTTPAPIPKTTDDVANGIAQTTNVTHIQAVVNAILPNLDVSTKTDLVSTLAKTKDPEEVKRVLDEAQTRQAEITKTVDEATPQPVPAQTIDQAVQESPTPVAPQQAPEQVLPTETAAPSPAGVADATDATNVPGTAGDKLVANFTDPNTGKTEYFTEEQLMDKWMELKSIPVGQRTGLQANSIRDIEGILKNLRENSTEVPTTDATNVPNSVDPLEALKAEARNPKNLDELFNDPNYADLFTPQKQPANAFQDTLPSKNRPKSVQDIVKSGGNPLYHDTDAKGIIGILDTGELKPSQAPFSSIAGQGKRVSTTRNFDNYSRYHDSPYRLVIDESKTGQKSIPDNREEFESIFNKPVKTNSVQALAIDTTNPSLIKDMQNGKLAEVLAKAKEKGIAVEPFDGKILPDEAANKEIQWLTKQQFTDLYNQATQPTPPVQKPTAVEPPKPEVTPDATNVPGAIDAGGTPPPTPPQTPSGMAPEPEPGAGATKDFNNYIDDIAQSQGIDTTYQAPEMFAFNKLLSKATGGRVRNLMQINPLRKGAQKLEDTISNKAQQVNTGKGSKTLNTARTVWSQTGISDVNRQANRRFRDAQSLAGDLTKREMRIGDDLMGQLPNGETSIDNIYRVIADDNILKRTHGDNARLTLNDLSPEEQVVASRIIEAQKRTNEINYKIGKITKEQYEAEKELGHYARIFDIESNKGKSLGKKPIDTKPFIGQKDPAEFSDSLMEKFIKDPYRGALARQEIALRSLASHEFMQNLADNGNLLSYKPNKGFQQLTGKKYGKFEGMWADNTTRAQIKQNMEFEGEWAKRYVGQLLDDYKATWAGKTQRVLKATKTVLNPGTNIQNFMSNVLLFNKGSGVGILRNLGGITKAGKDLAQARNGNLTGELIKAKKLGVFGSDSGKAMVGDIGAEELASIPGKKGFAMKALGTAEDIYGGTDNAAKLALWRNLQKKGMSAEDAALQVQKFTQDYHNVGRVIGAMADAPVLGKPFARFIPELVRLTKNNLLYNPAGTIAGLAALAYTANALSQMANESDEDRKLREDQVGNTSLPGTAWLNKALGGPNRDISLNFAVGDSSVNIARAVGLNFPMEPGSDPNRALLEQLLPFEIPTRKDAQGNEVFDANKIITQLGVRPLVEVITDRNFIGQSIRDPENKTRVEGSELGKTYQGDISKGEKAKNIAGHLFRAYAPMGNEIDSMVAAIKGDPNAFGKERTPLQAALRVFGVKVEKNDMKTREKRAETKEFFDGKLGQVNDFLNKNPDLKETYLRLKSGTVDRATGKKVVDLVRPEKWQLITSDKSGRLFDQLKTENEYLNKQNSNYPIDPIFRKDLSKEQRNQVLQIRSSYSGDNIEQEEILRATAPWYNKFEAAERDYNDKMSKYFKDIPESKTQNERVKAYGELYNKYAPQQTPLMQRYYQLKESNPQAAKDLFKTNPELSDQFDAYKQQKLRYINEKRKIEGVPPIDDNTFNNVTFGYEDDERKVYNELRYGKFGFGAGGGSSYGRFGYSRKGSTKEAVTPSLDLSTLLAGVKPQSIEQSSVIDTTPKKLKFKVKVPSSSKGKRLRLQ